jgi:DNA polymerase III delta prime subunit
MSLSDLVWELRYRPNKVVDVVLPATTTKMIQEQVASGNLPNYLFCGSPGVGKTTLAYAIAAELGADVLFINASLDGNIDTLRTKIAQFVSTVSFTDSKKIVILDEADYLNPNSVMPALRGFMDEFSSNATFILTCNYPERIIQPLQSRLTRIDFKFSKDEKSAAAMHMLKRVCSILDIEKVKYDKKAVAGLITKNFPDFRKTLVDLQRYSSSGEIDSGILATIDDTGMTELVSALKEKNFGKCRQWVANNPIEPQQFYRMFYDKVSLLLVPQSVPQMILLIGDAQFKATHSVDQEINQIAFIIQLMSSCQFK